MMSRLCRFGLLVVCIAGWGAPASVEAQVFPWAYDTMYPQNMGYTSYYTGSSSYSGTPYVTGYAPGAGCGCQQSYYSYGYGSSACGCSPCAGSCGYGCASGNCSTGNCAGGNCATGNCSTTVNSSASGAMTPTPDPLNSSRNIENRLDVIEKTLNIAPPKNRTYEDNFGPGRNRNGVETTIPNRARGTSNEDDFKSPIQGRQRETDDNEPFRENPPANSSRDAFKANTGSTLDAPGTSDTVIPAKKPAPGPAIDDADDKKNQTLRLDTQVTSRAVSPRERQPISVGFAKSAVASTKTTPKLQLEVKSNSVNVARN